MESTTPELTGRLSGALFTECAEWIWEQLQDEGYNLAGELVELMLVTERELGVQARPLDEIARLVDEELRMRGVVGNPVPITAQLVRVVLEWEDDFLGFAAIPRSES
jgi:hypothetical protein